MFIIVSNILSEAAEPAGKAKNPGVSIHRPVGWSFFTDNSLFGFLWFLKGAT